MGIRSLWQPVIKGAKNCIVYGVDDLCSDIDRTSAHGIRPYDNCTGSVGLADFTHRSGEQKLTTFLANIDVLSEQHFYDDEPFIGKLSHQLL